MGYNYPVQFHVVSVLDLSLMSIKLVLDVGHPLPGDRFLHLCVCSVVKRTHHRDYRTDHLSTSGILEFLKLCRLNLASFNAA